MTDLKTGRTDASCLSRIRESLGFSPSMWPCGPRGMTHRSWILSSTCTYTFSATLSTEKLVEASSTFLYFNLTTSCYHFLTFLCSTQIWIEWSWYGLIKESLTKFYSTCCESVFLNNVFHYPFPLSCPASAWLRGMPGEIRHNQPTISCQEGKKPNQN